MTLTATRTFTSAEVCEFAGITYKQLDHWVRRGWLSPNLAPNEYGNGIGHDRIWSEHEAVKAVAMARMVRAGISHAKAAELVAARLTATLHVTELSEGLP